jgi:hypothetical protein
VRLKSGNTFQYFLLTILLGRQSALAECRKTAISFENQNQSATIEASALGSVLSHLTGCNFIFEPGLEKKLIQNPQRRVELKDLVKQVATQLEATLSSNQSAYVFAKSKVELKATGRLVSLELNNSPISSVNKILKKLGTQTLINDQNDRKISASLQDIPLDDLVTILNLISKGSVEK